MLETDLTNVIQKVPNKLHITSNIITILLLLLLSSSSSSLPTSSSSYLKSLDGGKQLYFLVKIEKKTQSTITVGSNLGRVASNLE